MEFKDFRTLFQERVSQMLGGSQILFLSDVDKDRLWDIYLESFPTGSNPILRERRSFDCSCCRHFIKTFGGVVTIDENNKVQTIWDFTTDSDVYQSVVDALSNYVKSLNIVDVFVTDQNKFGVDCNYEKLPDDTVRTWHHFYIELPSYLVTTDKSSIGRITGNYRDVRNVFQRSLEEINKDAVESVLDLIASKSLYKGEEWFAVLSKFLTVHNEYHKLSEVEKANYCWRKSVELGASIGKIRNHSIGVLLTDLSVGIDFDKAVKRYENIVAPSNYKRPKAIFTKKMIEEAQLKLTDLGLMNSLNRRFAVLEDISVNNILFANRDIVRRMEDSDVFAELQKESTGASHKFDRVESIEIDTFVSDVLPRISDIELFLENRHSSNMMSLIAPQDKTAPTMFKWSNPFSWAYHGNITDSMKERVKAAGGNVEGVLRFSIQWNEDKDNQNDFDAHCIEPNGNRIWFRNKGNKHPSTGMLDVDIIDPGSKTAVENITWTNIEKMQEGTYTFLVNTFSYRGGRSGFRAEIEYDGQIYSFEHNKNSRTKEDVIVAKIEFSRNNGVKFVYSLPSNMSSRELWGLNTQNFYPVSVLMYSPNYWDNQHGIGHRHLFFMLKGCVNDTSPNGFFNEFLREDLMVHKRVFEALGSKMRVDVVEDQLSGVGFSTTKRNSVICKLGGRIDRVLKVTF